MQLKRRPTGVSEKIRQAQKNTLASLEAKRVQQHVTLAQKPVTMKSDEKVLAPVNEERKLMSGSVVGQSFVFEGYGTREGARISGKLVAINETGHMAFEFRNPDNPLQAPDRVEGFRPTDGRSNRASPLGGFEIPKRVLAHIRSARSNSQVEVPIKENPVSNYRQTLDKNTRESPRISRKGGLKIKPRLHPTVEEEDEEEEMPTLIKGGKKVTNKVRTTSGKIVEVVEEAPRRRGRPPGSKNKPRIVQTVVETPEARQHATKATGGVYVIKLANKFYEILANNVKSKRASENGKVVREALEKAKPENNQILVPLNKTQARAFMQLVDEGFLDAYDGRVHRGVARVCDEINQAYGIKLALLAKRYNDKVAREVDEEIPTPVVKPRVTAKPTTRKAVVEVEDDEDEEEEIPTPVVKRGRPPGSKNKVKPSASNGATSAVQKANALKAQAAKTRSGITSKLGSKLRR